MSITVTLSRSVKINIFSSLIHAVVGVSVPLLMSLNDDRWWHSWTPDQVRVRSPRDVSLRHVRLKSRSGKLQQAAGSRLIVNSRGHFDSGPILTPMGW